MKILMSHKDRLDAIKTALKELINDGQFPDNSKDSAQLIRAITNVCDIEWIDTDSKREATQLLEEMIVISF